MSLVTQLQTLATRVATEINAVRVQAKTESFTVAVGDNTTALTAGTGKEVFRMPFGFTLSAVRASLISASTSGVVTVNVKASGVTIFSTQLTVDANEKTSVTAATAAVISDTALSDDEEISIDIVGGGTGATGLKVTFYGTRT